MADGVVNRTKMVSVSHWINQVEKQTDKYSHDWAKYQGKESGKKNDEIVMKIWIMPRTIFVAVLLLEINSKGSVITLP